MFQLFDEHSDEQAPLPLSQAGSSTSTATSTPRLLSPRSALRRGMPLRIKARTLLHTCASAVHPSGEHEQCVASSNCPVLSFPVPENCWPTACVTQICHIYPIILSVQEECTPNHSSQSLHVSGCHQVACCRCKPCFNIMFFQIKCGNHHARSFGRMVR